MITRSMPSTIAPTGVRSGTSLHVATWKGFSSGCTSMRVTNVMVRANPAPLQGPGCNGVQWRQTGPAMTTPNFGPTRIAWHTVGQQVLARGLYDATGRIGLRATPGGFGTPPFDTSEGQ